MTSNPNLTSFAVELPADAHTASILDRVRALLRGVTHQQNRSLRCVETLQLGPKRAVYLLECDGQRFLAGTGQDGITSLLPLNQRLRAGSNVKSEVS